MICLVLALLLPALHAEDLRVRHEHVWIRRVTLATGCAASIAFDSWSTHRVAAAGGVEQNGLLSNSQGAPQWGRIIGMKAGFCGASLLMQETHLFGASDWTWTGLNAATTGIYTWVGFHNLKLANDLKKTTP
jgi:hypothetical protein